MMQERFVRRSDVERMTGLSKATIYRRIGAQNFPSPYRIGEKSVRWRETELVRWQEQFEPTKGAPSHG